MRNYILNDYGCKIHIFECNPKTENLRVELLAQRNEKQNVLDIEKSIQGYERVASINGGLFDASIAKPSYIQMCYNGEWISGKGTPCDGVRELIWTKSNNLVLKDVDIETIASGYSQASWIRSGTYCLVWQGNKDNYGKAQYDNQSRFNQRTARSMMGQKADGTLLLVVAEAPGLLGAESTNLMFDLGCINAINLDGGGSSQLEVEGKIVNKCSDGQPRKVTDCIAVYKKKEDTNVRYVDKLDSLIDKNVKLFDKGFGLRVTYATDKSISNYLTRLGVKYYGGHKGEDICAYDGANYKLPKNTYKLLMPFISMVCTNITNNRTNTFHLQGYDDENNEYLLKIAHCRNLLFKQGATVIKNQFLATISDVGVTTNGDNSHAHMELYKNGKLISFMETLDKKIEIYSQKKEEANLIIKVHKIGLRVRKNLAFSGNKPIGAVIGFLQIGDTIKLKRFVSGLQKDGYQWAEVEYKGSTAYCQYDSTCYTIEQK